jgi:hypothetical protein
MAKEMDILFPKTGTGRVLTIIYEAHGGMSLIRPFESNDTVQVNRQEKS